MIKPNYEEYWVVNMTEYNISIHDLKVTVKAGDVVCLNKQNPALTAMQIYRSEKCGDLGKRLEFKLKVARAPGKKDHIFYEENTSLFINKTKGYELSKEKTKDFIDDLSDLYMSEEGSASEEQLETALDKYLEAEKDKL